MRDVVSPLHPGVDQRFSCSKARNKQIHRCILHCSLCMQLCYRTWTFLSPVQTVLSHTGQHVLANQQTSRSCIFFCATVLKGKSLHLRLLKDGYGRYQQVLITVRHMHTNSFVIRCKNYSTNSSIMSELLGLWRHVHTAVQPIAF